MTLKFTYDDFLQFPDDGKRNELIDGDHYSTPSPDIRHQRISGNLTLTIALWLQGHPLGELFFGPLDVILSEFDVVEPDLLFVSNKSADTPRRRVRHWCSRPSRRDSLA